MTVTAAYTSTHIAYQAGAKRAGLHGPFDARVLVATLEAPGTVTYASLAGDLYRQAPNGGRKAYNRSADVRRSVKRLERGGLVNTLQNAGRVPGAEGRPPAAVTLTLTGARLARWIITQATTETTE